MKTRRRARAAALGGLAALMANGIAPAGADAPAAPESPTERVEARSADLLAVGIVHGERMSIRLSQVKDNAPVADAEVTVVLRGGVHPATAQTDGSYRIDAAELAVPGNAAVDFKVKRAAAQDILHGSLTVAGGPVADQDKNGARQLGWWVLNFAVCIGFLMLWSRRRKAPEE